MICGVATKIVTSVETTAANVADTKMFKPLVNDTGSMFNLKAICADKAYSSRENMEIANALGALPYIPFKKNSTKKSKGSPTWAKMYRFFTENYYNFAQEYHKRSNVESCWAMIKRKFGDFCRCRTPVSQDNEILGKILVHNVVVLVHEIFNRGLDVNFLEEAKRLDAQKVI
jgi:transposase